MDRHPRLLLTIFEHVGVAEQQVLCPAISSHIATRRQVARHARTTWFARNTFRSFSREQPTTRPFLRAAPGFSFVGDWTGYTIRPARTRASLRSFFRSNNVPLLKLLRLAPSPSLSATHRTVFSRHQISYILDLPLYIPGVDAYRRVSVSRCFPVRILTMVMTLRIIFRHG